MIREDNQAAGKSWTWEYDDAGNILSKSEYAYTTGTLGTAVDTVSYAYSNANWGDLLTSYDGQVIEYDGIGNPTKIGSWNLSWEHGRELASMSNGASTWTYTYDGNGMRSSRTDGTTSYSYVYNGSQLVQETITSSSSRSVLNYFYDAGGSPLYVVYNNIPYFYVLNLQGDVVALINASGTKVVEYTYDAWGNPLTITGSLASTLGQQNALRYRGYVFDQETGLYYLQSRYYDPEVGRFLNADIYVTTGQGILSCNMFAYCNNNPVIAADHNGEWFNLVIGAVAGAVISGISTALQGGDFDEIVISSAMGGISGLLGASGIGGLAGQMVIGAITSGLDSAVQNYNDYLDGEKNMGEAIACTAADMFLGAAFGAMGFEGDAMFATDVLADAAIDGFKTMIKKGVHPLVKTAAKEAWKQGKRYLMREGISAAIENGISSGISFVTSEVIEAVF